MSIANDLFEKGYSIHTLSTSEAFNMCVMKLEALKFFQNPQDVKDYEKHEGKHIGYRPVGGEYVGTPEFWDINESVNYSHMAAHLIRDRSSAKDFYEAAQKMLPVYDQIVQTILKEIKEHYRSDQMIPETKNSSWIQINYYQQAVANRVKRELMQGKHEDGHLVTIWSAQEAGMEFFPKGPNEAPQPLHLSYNEVLVMPGDLLTRATGGDIQPMFHQVRRIENVHTRLAAMYFPNPNPSTTLLPYANHAEQIDLAALTKDDKLVIRPGTPTNEQ
ncbi:MAG: hypothetical protein CL570_00330 [Alphaproteobacteria bacterium]|nr:hypothetical protein [Alphaproteobacteria bacterium]|tara:strand:- start:10248 stop:11069 length:822 start_codon:yes stop_codon:yes gene_type:complete